MKLGIITGTLLLAAAVATQASEPLLPPSEPNQVAGTWRMVSATLENDGATEHPYGENPQGMLVFTADMHFVQGRFAGNYVEGSTFPNWVGSERSSRELQLRVEGDRMYETFTRPDGGRVSAEFVRVR